MRQFDKPEFVVQCDYEPTDVMHDCAYGWLPS